MNAIDEMYEKYGVSQMYLGREECGENRDGYPIWGGEKYFKTLEDADRANYTVLDDEPEYPPFTAEKQLEIIKLISSNHYLSTIEYDDGSRGFTVEYYKTDKNDSWVCHVVEANFDEALAQLTIELLKLNELDNRAVKEILER